MDVAHVIMTRSRPVHVAQWAPGRATQWRFEKGGCPVGEGDRRQEIGIRSGTEVENIDAAGMLDSS
jgi:hypothetical protein